MSNTLKFGNGEWYGKEGTILAYNSENNNYKPLPFTFDRDSVATRVNKQGLIETVGADQPRIDYLNDSKGALLLEPQSTNLVPYSEDFSQSYWSKIRSTITSNQIISPDGTLNGDLLTATDTSENYCQQNVSSTVSGSKQTVSFFVKKGTSDFCHILLWDVSDDGARQWFDLNNGIVGTSTNFGNGISVDSAHMINYGNDWFRCIAVFNNSNTIVRFRISASNSNGGTTSTVGKTIYLWGAQLEQGSYATSYIPTEGSAVTRVYDTMPDYLDITPLNIGNSYTLFLDANLNVNENNKVFLQLITSSSTTSFTVRNNVGGVRAYNQLDSNYPVSGIISSSNKFVIRVDGNSYKIFVKGSSLSGTLTTQRDLGKLNFIGNNTELKINNFTIDDTALSDAECQALVN